MFSRVDPVLHTPEQNEALYLAMFLNIDARTYERLKVMMRMAIDLSDLSTCDRLHVGVLIYDPRTKQIVSTGYNGAPKNKPHCIDVGCEIVDGHCINALHGDDNALHRAGQAAEGCWMVINYTPCRRCANRIINSGITRVIYHEPYGSDYQENLDTLEYAGVQCLQIKYPE